MEIEKESVKDVNENEVKELMDEQVAKFTEHSTSSSMGQTSSQDWKDKVTSSVLHNFVPTSISKDRELPNHHHHSLLSSAQGCSFIQKHSQKTACAKDLSVHDGNILNRVELSFQKNGRECPNDNHSSKCFGYKRHRRYTWSGTQKPLEESHETKSVNDYCSTLDGNFQGKVNVRRCRSTSCLNGIHAQNHSTNNSSSPCLATYERRKITEENHIKSGCICSQNPTSSSICDVEYNSNSTSESALISTEDTKNNVSHLGNDNFASNITSPSLFFQKSKFYNSHREHFITDVISNVQKFAKENSLGPNLSKYVDASNEPKLVFNHENFHNIVHEKKDNNLSDKNEDIPSNSAQQPSLESSGSIKLVATKSDVKKKNELERLYDSLREIRWAQNITAKSLMMETKLRRHSVRIAGEATRKTATLSTMYKRVLPNRAIRKGEVVGGKAAAKSKQANHMNFKGQLPPRLVSKSKPVNRSTALKPKDRVGNHVPHRTLPHKLLQAELQNSKRKVQNCKTQNTHPIQITGNISHKQNISTQPSTNKQISLCSETFCKDGKPENLVPCTSKCSSSSSLCSADRGIVKGGNKKSDIASSLNYSLRNPKMNMKSLSCIGEVKNISKQKIDHSKSVEMAHKIPVQQNKNSTYSSSKLSNCAMEATKCSKALKQSNGTNMDDRELYERWKAETCGKEEELAFGILRIQGYKAPSHNLLKNKRKLEQEDNSSKLCPREFTLHYKGITVKRNPSYTQVIFKLNGCMNGRTHSFLSVEDMVELKETLEVTRRDPSCQVLLLTGSDDYFCSGLDLQPLLGERKEKAACEMAKAVKELMEALAAFTKPLVIAVNGDAMGLGVTLLTYSDVVLASDNAVFSMPYSQLGYVPEGAGTLTLPQVMGVTVAADMLIRGKQLTAHQAQHHGLVSEVIKKDHLMGYAIPRVLTLAKQPLHAMETTKSMMRCHLWEKLQTTLEKELDILPRQWLSSACQQAITKAFEDGFFFN